MGLPKLQELLSPPLNKPHITLRITPLKISLIFLLEAIPEISRPSNWLRSLALVCAGSGVIYSVMGVYSGGGIVYGWWPGSSLQLSYPHVHATAARDPFPFEAPA
jgi:hypothetical protein